MRLQWCKHALGLEQGRVGHTVWPDHAIAAELPECSQYRCTELTWLAGLEELVCIDMKEASLGM